MGGPPGPLAAVLPLCSRVLPLLERVWAAPRVRWRLCSRCAPVCGCVCPCVRVRVCMCACVRVCVRSLWLKPFGSSLGSDSPAELADSLSSASPVEPCSSTVGMRPLFRQCSVFPVLLGAIAAGSGFVLELGSCMNGRGIPDVLRLAVKIAVNEGFFDHILVHSNLSINLQFFDDKCTAVGAVGKALPFLLGSGLIPGRLHSDKPTPPVVVLLMLCLGRFLSLCLMLRRGASRCWWLGVLGIRCLAPRVRASGDGFGHRGCGAVGS